MILSYKFQSFAQISKILLVILLLTPSLLKANEIDNGSNFLIGKWDCSSNVNLGAMELNITLKNQFKNDKTGGASGIVNVINPSIGMNLSYQVILEFDWHISDNLLLHTITKRSITSLKPSFYESLYNTDDFLKIGQVEAIELVTLNQENLNGLYLNTAINCLRSKKLTIRTK